MSQILPKPINWHILNNKGRNSEKQIKFGYTFNLEIFPT